MGQSRDEKEWIIMDRISDIILANVDGCVVDIGMGFSTIVLAKHAKAFGRTQYSVEARKKRAKWYKSQNLHSKHIIVNDKVENFIETFNEEISIVFYDADHRYPIVRKVFDSLIELVNPWGVFFIHDTFPPYETRAPRLSTSEDKGGADSYKLRQELEKDDRFWTFTWPYETQAQGYGLTMVMKKKPDEEYFRK